MRVRVRVRVSVWFAGWTCRWLTARENVVDRPAGRRTGKPAAAVKGGAGAGAGKGRASAESSSSSGRYRMTQPGRQRGYRAMR